MTQRIAVEQPMVAAAVTHKVAPAHPRFFGSLQAGRGIAALIVVLYHCEGIFGLPKYWHTPKYFFYFGASGVEYFFVLSGIVIMNAHLSDVDHPAAIRSYAWKRFRRIYPLYWLLLLLVLPLYFRIPSFGNGFETQPAVILDSFLLLPLTRLVSILPTAWTLYHEIMFYLVFSTLLLRKKLGLFVLSTWLAGSVFALFVPIHNSVLSAYFSPLHLLFGLGLFVLLFVRRATMQGMPFFVIGLLGFVSCCIFDDFKQPVTPFFPLVYGVFAALAAGGLMLIEKTRKLSLPGFLTLLGDASYSVYLIHYMVLSAAAKIAYPLWRRHPVPLVLPFLFLIVCAVTVGILVHLFVERPLLKQFSKR